MPPSSGPRCRSARVIALTRARNCAAPVATCPCSKPAIPHTTFPESTKRQCETETTAGRWPPRRSTRCSALNFLAYAQKALLGLGYPRKSQRQQSIACNCGSQPQRPRFAAAANFSSISRRQAFPMSSNENRCFASDAAVAILWRNDSLVINALRRSAKPSTSPGATR